MKQTALTVEQVRDLRFGLDSDDLVRPYSGRGMSGVECLGIEFDAETDLVSWAFAMGEEGGELARLLADGARVDDMGSRVVAYWPHVAMPVENDDE